MCPLPQRSKGRRWTALPAWYAAQARAAGVPVIRDAQRATRRTQAAAGAIEINAATYAAMSEYDHQVRLMEQCEAFEHGYPGLCLINASANGGLRKRGVAGQLRAMGVKSGFPDIQLPVPRGDYIGLFIELKKIGGRPTDNQRWWQAELQAQGHLALIIEGWEAAWAAIQAYYELPTRQH